jgi:hypothetical protein
MTEVSIETLIPHTAQIVDGMRVYQSTHMITVFNDSGADIFYNVEATMFDTLGHSNSTSALNVIATSGDAEISSGMYVVNLDANLYDSGTVAQITCETHVTAGLSATDRQSGELIIE